MADIIHLGFDVDLTKLVSLEKQLDKTAEAGAKVEKAGGLIARSMGSASTSASNSGGLIAKSLDKAGTSGNKAGGLIAKSMKSADADIQAAARSVGSLKSSFGGVGGIVAKIAGGLASLGAAKFFLGTIKESELLQRNLLRTEQLVKSTGAAAGFSAKELHEQARQMALGTLESTEGVMAAQQILLTFKSVSGDTFTRATELAADLATVTGGDLKGSMTQLGKALEDPVKGINAMARSGVSFTESQKEMIKSLVATGDKAAAQKLILDELATQYGGVAQAEAKGYAGSIDTLGQAFQEVQQYIGGAVTEGELMPAVINALADALFGTVDVLKGFATSWGVFTENLKSGDGIYATARSAVSGIGKAIDYVANAIAPALPYVKDFAGSAAAVVASVVGGAALFSGVASSIGLVGGAIKAVGLIMAANPIALLVGGIALTAKLIYDNWDAVSGYFENLWAKVKETTSAASDFLKNLFPLQFAAISGAIKVGAKLIQGDFSGAWALVVKTAKDFGRDLLASLSANIASIRTVGLSLIRSLIDGIKSALADAIEAVKGVGSSIVQGLKDSMPSMSGIGKNIVEGLSSGITSAGAGAVKATKNVGKSIVSGITGFFRIKSPSRLMMPLGKNITEGVAVGIKSGGLVAVTAAKEVSAEVSHEFTQFSNSITDTLSSALLDGDFESVGSSLLDTFKNDILNPILDNAIKPFSDAISNTMSGIGDSISSTISGSTSSMGQSGGGGIMSVMQGGGLSGALMGGGMGMMAGQALGQSGIGTGIGGAIGSIWGPLGSAIGAGLGGLVESLFGGKKKISGQGVNVGYSSQGGFAGNQYTNYEKKRSFWRGTKRWTETSALDSEVTSGINAYFDQVDSIVTEQAKYFGADAEALLSSFSVGNKKFSGSDIEGQITNWSKDVTNQIYDTVFGTLLDDFGRSGESLSDTIARLISQTEIVSAAFDLMNYGFDYSIEKMTAVSDGLVNFSGGIEALASNLESYYNTVYTQAERTELERAKAGRQLVEFSESIGLTGDAVIDTAAELRKYVEALDLTTEAGQEAYANAIAMSSALATYAGTAEDALSVTESLANSINSMGTDELIEQLYGTADERYRTELAYYNDLKSGAESLRDTANKLFGEIADESKTLGESQREYNSLLQQVQAGDTSLIGELQTSASALNKALSNTYGPGADRANIGVSEIVGQLNQVADSIDVMAGGAPVNPADAERQALVESLVSALQESGLAQDISVHDLINQHGINIRSLADDLGVDISSLSADYSNLGETIASSINGLNMLQAADLERMLAASNVDVNDVSADSITDLGQIIGDFGITLYDLIDGMDASVESVSSAVSESISSIADGLFTVNKKKTWFGTIKDDDEHATEKRAYADEIGYLLESLKEAQSSDELASGMAAIASFTDRMRELDRPSITDNDIALLESINSLIDSIEIGTEHIASGIVEPSNNSSGSLWTRLFSDLFNALPSYDVGSDGVNGNQLANIHSGEAIFTASQTKGLRQSVLGALSAMARMDKPASVVVMDQGGDALGEQIKGLRSDNALMIEEIKLLRDEQERANFEIAKNTKNSAETLDDWERNGMPQEAV